MNRIVSLFAVLILVSGLHAARITESLDNWTMGTNQPEIATGTRGDGSTGEYIHLLLGTSAMYYEVMEEGEGSATLWVYDGGLCLENPNPGYPTNGPRWGFQSPLYQSLSVGIGRASYVAGCIGYSPWSTVAPYSYRWFKDGIRGANSFAFTAGWYKWTIAGTWDDLSFTLHDVTYLIQDGAGTDPSNITTGDCTQTYDATSFGGAWEALFGEGWKALWIQGDGASGIEDMNVDVTGGTGVFTEFGTAVSGQFERASWSNVKQTFR